MLMLSFTLSNIWEYTYNSCFNVLILPFYCFCHLCHFWTYSLIAFSLSKKPHFPESLPYWLDVWGSILTRIILWTKEPGVGLQRVRHVWSDWAHAHAMQIKHLQYLSGLKLQRFISCLWHLFNTDQLGLLCLSIRDLGADGGSTLINSHHNTKPRVWSDREDSMKNHAFS